MSARVVPLRMLIYLPKHFVVMLIELRSKPKFFAVMLIDLHSKGVNTTKISPQTSADPKAFSQI